MHEQPRPHDLLDASSQCRSFHQLSQDHRLRLTKHFLGRNSIPTAGDVQRSTWSCRDGTDRYLPIDTAWEPRHANTDQSRSRNSILPRGARDRLQDEVTAAEKTHPPSFNVLDFSVLFLRCPILYNPGPPAPGSLIIRTVRCTPHFSNPGVLDKLTSKSSILLHPNFSYSVFPAADASI